MTRSPSSTPPDPLPMRWAVILVAAVVVSLLVGALTFTQTASWPATLLAAVGASGEAIPALRQMVGK